MKSYAGEYLGMHTGLSGHLHAIMKKSFFFLQVNEKGSLEPSDVVSKRVFTNCPICHIEFAR